MRLILVWTRKSTRSLTAQLPLFPDADFDKYHVVLSRMAFWPAIRGLITGGPRAGGPRAGGVCRRAGARAGGGVPTQGLGQRRSPQARRRQIHLVVLDERCAVVCRTRIAKQFPAESKFICSGGPEPDNMTNL